MDGAIRGSMFERKSQAVYGVSGKYRSSLLCTHA